ncbi:MAG: hypothetical protein DMF80_15935 [Acidobacteria bacterium]|nr:MAG: hypothetical protein DMF80_15935 [Acidobacteriota bacterium]
MGIRGARVLVVDDDVESLEAVARLLRGRGAQVITVSSPGCALATVIGVVPDVMVVDLDMPGQHGIGLVRAIRSLSPEKGGQVPAITGHLAKPLDAEALVELVDRLAGHAVERRRMALDRRQWPRDVSRDRRAEVRDEASATCAVETALQP